MEDLPRVVIAIPSYRSLPSESFQHLVMSIMENVHKGYLVGAIVEAGLYITVSRNRLAAKALEAYHKGMCTHVWWLDDDVTVPPDALEKLLAHKVPAVTGLYYAKECLPMAYSIRTRGDPIGYIAEIPDELTQIDGAGFGCLLMEAHILDDMYKHFGTNQWFQTPPNLPEIDFPGEVGEDLFFCERLKEMGVPLYLDPEVNCGHIRYFELNRTVSRIFDYGMAAIDEADL